MKRDIRKFLKGIKVGAKQKHANMTVYCLLAKQESSIDFLVLDKALETGALSIREVHESGSVPELLVANKSDNKVLMLDGEELVGSKQNRVLNVTILVGEHTETIIPVSCVEQGRWSYRSREFGSERRAMNAALRKKKSETVASSLLACGSFASDQELVWDEIEAKYERMETSRAPTGAMADLFEAHSETAGDYLERFQVVDNQVGIVVFIDGKVAGVEILPKYGAFKELHEKLVHSYVMDALETAGRKSRHRSKPSRSRASKIMEAAGKASMHTHESVALGTDFRLESEEIMAAGLEFEGQVLHLTIFLKEEEDRGRSPKSQMRRASGRKFSLRR